jgi:hypothetical protein
MKTERQLTTEELDLVFKKLEEKIKTIKEENFDFFNTKNNPKSIDYIYSPGVIDWTGLTPNNISFLSFNKGLNDEIKNDVKHSFIDIVNELLNKKNSKK